MKNIITTILITLLTYSLYAQVSGIGQVPLGMKYQAVARGADGQAMNSEDITLQFTILRDNTPVFSEVQATSTNNLGLFVLTIGSVNNTDYSNIDWRLGDHFLKVEVNDGGWQDLGTHQLLSVPYAMTAGNGKQIGGANQEFITAIGANGSANAIMTSQGTGNHGQFIVLDDEGESRGWLYSGNSKGGAGNLLLRGENGSVNASMGVAIDNNHGGFALSNDAGETRVLVISNPNRGGRGGMDFRGENGNINLSITNEVDNNHGAITIHDSAQQRRLAISSNPNRNGAGLMSTYGANLNPNVSITTSQNHNHGAVTVHSGNGVGKAGMYVDNVGVGIVWGDDKCFRMNHPKDPTKEIWYASIEGPEAAAYERGTAQLVDGEAQINFSDHFELVVNAETVTFVLTPRSADSEGLAIIEQDESGFVVKELRGGTGNYKFDWRVEGVRKGREDFQVIRDKAEMERMIGIDPTGEVQQKSPQK